MRLFCSQFFFERESIVDTMTDFKGKMRTKESVLDVQLIVLSLLSLVMILTSLFNVR